MGAKAVVEYITKKTTGVREFPETVGEMDAATAANTLTDPGTGNEVVHTIGYQVHHQAEYHIIARTFDPVTEKYSDFAYIPLDANYVSSAVILLRMRTLRILRPCYSSMAAATASTSLAGPLFKGGKMSKPREFKIFFDSKLIGPGNWCIKSEALALQHELHNFPVEFHVIEKSAVEKLIQDIEGEIRILEAAGHKGSALGLKIALKKYGGWNCEKCPQ